MNHAKMTTKIAGIVLAAAALCSLGTATATATTTNASPVTDQILVMTAGLDGGQTKTIPGFTCPAATPYLMSKVYESDREVPAGVQIEESGGPSGGIGVTILSQTTSTPVDGKNFVTGWKADDTWDQAHNWAPVYNNVSVYAHCSNDPADGSRYSFSIVIPALEAA